MDSDTVFYCTYCLLTDGTRIPLELRIIEITEWKAHFKRESADVVDDVTHQTIPTFAVETEDGVVEWEPKFICPTCKSPAYALNRTISYNDDEDLLYINDLEAELSGYKTTTLPIKLPKIQRPSQCSN